METPAAGGGRRVHPTSVLRLGTLAWSWLGILGLLAVVVLSLASVAGLVVPSVVAFVVAALLVPLVDRLERGGVPRSAGALLVLLGFLGVIGAVLWLAVSAVVSRWDLVSLDLRSGLAAVTSWWGERGVDLATPQELLRSATAALQAVLAGPANLVGGALSSLASFTAGAFIAVFLLYLLLGDWHRVLGWVSLRLRVPADVGAGLVSDVVEPLRRYYLALTVSSALVAVAVTVAAWLLDVPLALAIGVVTFVTAYVPYLGAIVSGAFAVLLALGSGGVGTAVAMLVVVLVMQNLVQTVVQARLTGAALSLHPIVTFSATIAGASLAGILGASLAVPLLAGARRVAERLRSS